MRRWLKAVLAIIAIAGFSSIAIGQAQTTMPATFDIQTGDAKAAMLIDPQTAADKAKAAEKTAHAFDRRDQQQIAISTARWLQGEAYLRLNDPDKAEPLIEQAWTIASRQAPGSKLLGDILMSRGGLFGAQAKVAAALADYQSAFTIFRTIRDARSQARALLLIASLYSDGNDNQSALRYFAQALEVYTADPGLSVSIYNNRGAILQDLGRYDEAEAEFHKALAEERLLNSPLLHARIIGNLARNRLKAGRTTLADRMIRTAMALTAKGEAAGWRPQILSIAAQSALQRGDTSRAGQLVNQAFDGVDLTQTSLSSREAHKTAYETYHRLNEPALALTHLMALKRLDDEATKLATSASTALMGARFDFANQELRITKLKADDLQRSIAFERDKAKTERLIFLGAGGATLIVIVMLAIGIVTLRRSRNAVRAANSDLAETNAALGKALAARTEFLATTSHEIRTPLNGILGMTQVMLVDTTLSATTQDRVRLVHDAGMTMRGLVDDILDVAKMETGNLTIEVAPFDIAEMMTDTCRLWEGQARAKGLGFDVAIALPDDRVKGDAARVRQIVSNLLSNALKFTLTGTVKVRAWQREQDLAYCIAISDSGIGVAADKREDIFESFRQADTSTTRQFGGTGLGLSICRNLARAMGGEVSVDSVVGEGSTFTLIVPLEKAETDCPADAVADDEPALLVVDRNPITRSMFRTLLSPHIGCILFVDSVGDAVGMMADLSVSKILVDDATLRASGDVYAGMRQIASTAHAKGATVTLLWPRAMASDHATLRDCGADAIVDKPMTATTLLAALFATGRADAGQVSLVTHAA